MPNTVEENADLELVQRLAFEPAGLVGRRFSSEELTKKTPDFRVEQNGTLVAYCEVKSPRDDWLDTQISVGEPGQIAGGLRDDPTFNRLSRHLKTAARQFDSVNPKSAELNVLIFVNHDRASGYADIREILTGYFSATDGSKHALLFDNILNRSREVAARIDLIGWVDFPTERIQGWVLNQVDEKRGRLALSLFRIKAYVDRNSTAEPK